MKTILQVLIVLGLMVLVVLGTRKFFPRIEVDVRTSIEYRDTTIYKDSLVPKPYPVKEYLPGDTVYLPADSAEITRLYLALHTEYNTVRNYEETTGDSVVNVKVEGRVTQNRLDSLNIVWDYKKFEKTITVTETIIPNNWYIYGETNFNTLSLGIIHSRNKFVYKGTYNLNDKTISLGVGYKIDKLW